MRWPEGLPGRPAADGMEIASITADSRRVSPGTLFAALPGARADGRAYIADAVARGAVAVLAPDGTAWPAGVPARPLILDPEPRRALARLAAAHAGPQPEVVVAVTGTNGKTSTAEFLRQLGRLAGSNAASLGTLGVVAPDAGPLPPEVAKFAEAGLTTPDPVALAQMLAQLARQGVARASLEASSHGLDQFRLDGLRLVAAGFSNLTRDHLDYHGSMEAYRAAKLRLFDALLPEGCPAVANADMDGETLDALRGIAARRRLELRLVGERGDAIRLLRAEPRPDGQELDILADGARRTVLLPLPGRFQADNALLTAELARATGLPRALDDLSRLQGVRGRMQLAARLPNGAAAYVDYAHTPDAIARLLGSLRPHARRLVVVFGAGGDRDPGKRPLMGDAARAADVAIVTDDNPRSEDPAGIRAAVAAGCPGAREVGGREAAIAAGLEALGPGDVLVVAGKGHEQGQTVAGTTLPFDDVSVVRPARRGAGMSAAPLWSADALRAATGGTFSVPFAATGVSIDTRTIRPGELFVALVGENGDGHDYVSAALRAGAAGALIHRDVGDPRGDAGGPLLRVADTLAGLHALGAAGRARFAGRVVAVTGSVGKTTTKEMLRRLLAAFGAVHAAEASYNNHWGVPLTLARLPADAAYCVSELGMNNPGEILPLARLASPHVAAVTALASAHIGHLGSMEAIADEKASIAGGLLPGGTVVLPADSPLLPRLLAAARDAGAGVRLFGAATGGGGPDAALLSAEGDAQGIAVTARVGGREVRFQLAAPGRHMAMNAVAALLCVDALGLDPARAAAALDGFAPVAGRGAQRVLPGGIRLLDESYNASGASVRAALGVLAGMPGRRVAVLGDMLELGAHGPAEHVGLAPEVAASADLLLTCGTLMEGLSAAAPPALRGPHAADSAALAAMLPELVRPGDAVLVKGSLGSRMRRVVQALEAHAERAMRRAMPGRR